MATALAKKVKSSCRPKEESITIHQKDLEWEVHGGMAEPQKDWMFGFKSSELPI